MTGTPELLLRVPTGIVRVHSELMCCVHKKLENASAVRPPTVSWVHCGGPTHPPVQGFKKGCQVHDRSCCFATPQKVAKSGSTRCNAGSKKLLKGHNVHYMCDQRPQLRKQTHLQPNAGVYIDIAACRQKRGRRQIRPSVITIIYDEDGDDKSPPSYMMVTTNI